MHLTHDMTSGKPAKLIILFALPLMLGNIFQQLYTITDSIIVGQGVGVDALAALGSVDWLNWMALGIVTGLTQGFAILYAKNYGARDEANLRKAIGQSIVIGLISIIAISILLIGISHPVLLLMKTDSQILAMGETYLKIMYGGLVISMLYNIAASILRALGNSRDPLIAMVVSSIVNISLDLLFVMVFGWGIVGAAVATLIAQFCSFLYCLKTIKNIPAISLQKEDFKLEKEMVGSLFKMGIPLALMNIVISIGGMVVQSVVNSYGLTFVAGFTVTNKLYGLLEIAATSFGFAMATYVSQNLGAKQLTRIKQGVKVATLMAVLTSIVISVIMILCGKFFIGLFLDSGAENRAQVIEIAYRYLTTMCYFLWVLYLLHLYRNSLQGLQDTLTPMATSIIELIMRISAVLILPKFIGSDGIFYAEILAWSGAAIMLVSVFFVRWHRLVQTFSDVY